MLALNLGKAMNSRLVTFDIGTHDATYIEKMAKRSGCELQGIKGNKATVYCKTGIDALNLIQNLEIKNFQSCLDDKIA